MVEIRYRPSFESTFPSGLSLLWSTENEILSLQPKQTRMKTELSDEEVVEVLARRMGWTNLKRSALGRGWYGTHEEYCCGNERASLPYYLTSRDALDPVLAGLSEEEWTKLHRLIVELSWQDHSGVKPTDRHRAFFNSKWLVTIPPSILARAIASVIKEGV